MSKAKTKIIKINPTKPQPKKIDAAATFIRNGKIVAFPTETVYGIGANAYDANATERIFAVKGRPSDNPLIVHVDSLAMAQHIGDIPKKYRKRISKIWPSPITFIVKARVKLPQSVTAGLDTVALRMPAHPVALALIKSSGVPIAAPSANPSKKPSATTGKQATRYFKGKIDCILDGGECFFGLESSIIDLRDFSLLRPGPFTAEEITKMFGAKPRITKVTRGLAAASRMVSPGTKYRHYSPDTKLYLSTLSNAKTAGKLAKKKPKDFAFIGSVETCRYMKKKLGCETIELGRRSDGYQIAKNLYTSLIKLDRLDRKFGVIESFDEKGIGLALMNRIRKAAPARL
ncbi:MAG: threonylcarbamoyl-AMP synthase [Candidatus Micrarchaeota archaeon]|nr:threonylcarbamoyl-AMP synthase [Candidatus Micrarchaeota archaeon]